MRLLLLFSSGYNDLHKLRGSHQCQTLMQLIRVRLGGVHLPDSFGLPSAASFVFFAATARTGVISTGLDLCLGSLRWIKEPFNVRDVFRLVWLNSNNDFPSVFATN